jgi:hypothetical protein
MHQIAADLSSVKHIVDRQPTKTNKFMQTHHQDQDGPPGSCCSWFVIEQNGDAVDSW